MRKLSPESQALFLIRNLYRAYRCEADRGRSAVIALIGATAGLSIMAMIGQPLSAFAQQPQEFTLKVTQQDLNSLGQAIQELPFKVAQPLFAKLQAQVAEQQKAAEPPRALEQPKAPEAEGAAK